MIDIKYELGYDDKKTATEIMMPTISVAAIYIWSKLLQ